MSMADTKEVAIEKVKETRFVIFTPFGITAVCAIFDIWFTGMEYNFLDILKTIYTYFFPSIISIMITLMAQQGIYQNGFHSIRRLPLSVFLLVVYSVAYIMWLSRYNICLSIVFGLLSIGYILLTWFVCLDRKLTHIKADIDTKEQKALERMVDEQK